MIVSGDFVDHPHPFTLLAVKCELESLSKKRALFVVPGNHDVRMWGNIVVPWRTRWFERIMFNDTAKARQAVEASLGIELGLNRACAELSLPQKLKRLNPLNAIRFNVEFLDAEQPMSVNKLAPNVVVCAPEGDPGEIDPKELLNLGWSPKLVEYLQQDQSSFENLRLFERRQAARYEAEASAAPLYGSSE